MSGLSLVEARAAIVGVGRWLDGKGWAPATAGNYSLRLGDGRIAITVSGRHKGRLTEADVMTVDLDGNPLDAKKPSAETELHCALYRRFEGVNAVLHSHSPHMVGLSRALAGADHYRLAGHEMLKTLPGITTHDTEAVLPITDNSQDMTVITADIMPRLAEETIPAYLIRGHGLYGWGTDLAEAERVIEAIEWMISAELAQLQFARHLGLKVTP